MEDQHISSLAKNWNSTLENLLKECGNHLCLGQLELFCGTIYSLLEIEHDEKENFNKSKVLQMLETVYRSAHGYCHGSRTLVEPSWFYWTIAKLHQEVSKVKDDNHQLVIDATFRDNSSRALFGTSDSFVKELYGIHQGQVWEGKRPPNAIISSECRKTFKELFKAKPDLAVALLGSLFASERRRYFNHSLDLLRILYEVVDYELNRLEICGRRSLVWLNDVADVEGTKTILYLLLTIGDALFIPWKEGTNSKTLEEFTKDVYDLVVRLWQLGERNAKQKALILDALASQKDMLFLAVFCSVDVKNKNRAEHCAEGFLRFNIKDMFLFSVSNRTHFLEMIVNRSVELVFSGEQLLVKSVLSNPALCRLKELVFLLTWSKVKNALDVIRVLGAYESLADNSIAADLQLNEACIVVVKKASMVLRALESNSARKTLANASYLGNVLSTLQGHSPLYILHSCHHLHMLDRKTAFAELESCYRSSCCDGAKHSDVLYTSFRLMYDLFQVVLTSVKMDSMVEDYKQQCRKLSRDSKNLLKEEFALEMKGLYEEHVTKSLHEIREGFTKWNSLTLRVEMLENAFSLLFLTHQALQKMHKDSSSDSEQCETTGKKKKKRSSNDFRTVKNSSETEMNISNIFGSECSSSLKKTFMTSSPTTSSENAGFKNTPGCCDTSKHRFVRRPRLGFIVSPFIIRDFLDCIQQCISDTRLLSHEGRLVSLTTEYVDIEMLASCNVQDKKIPQRILRLSQYVSEAVWRLQLVTDSSFPKEIGTFSAEEMLNYLQTKKHCEFHFYGPIIEEYDDSGDKVLDKADIVASCSKEFDKKISQRRQSYSARTSITSLTKPFDVISKMLSQHDSLLNICLKQDDLMKSTQVIQMFRLDSTDQATEVEFAIHFKNVVHRLAKSSIHSNSRVGRGRRPHAEPEKNLSVWNTIVEAAQAGANTADILIVDELLASQKVPIITEIEDTKITSQMNTYMPHPIDWKAFVRADLALVACGSIPVCQSLLESARSALSSETMPCQSKGMTRSRLVLPIKGILGFLDDVLSLISLKSLDKTNKDDSVFKLFSTFLPNVNVFLMQGMFMLSGEEHKKDYRTWLNVAKIVDQLRHLLESEDKHCHRGVVNTISVNPTDSAMPSLSTDKSDPRRHPIHVVFNKLQKLSLILCCVFNEETYSTMAAVECGRDKLSQMPAYLATFYEYAEKLSNILHQLPTSVNQQGSYFSVFQHSPSAIMDQLLFDESASAEYLEKFSKQLGLDLLHAVVRQCCPKIPISQHKEIVDAGIDLEKPIPQAVDQFRKMPVYLLEFIQSCCWLVAVIVQAVESTKSFPCEGDVSEWALVLHPTLHRLLEFRGASACSSEKVIQSISPLMNPVCIKMKFDQLMNRKEFVEALDYLDSWECQSPASQEHIEPLRDEVLSHLALTRLGPLPPWIYLQMITDSSIRAEIIRKLYLKWPIEGVLSALDVCCSDENLEHTIRDDFRLLWRKAKLYYTICNELQSRGITWSSEYPTCTWKSAAKMSSSEPFTLLSILHNMGCFAAILEWSCLHEISTNEVKQIVDEVYLLSSLDTLTVNTVTIRQALERITDSKRRAMMYQRLLDRAREVSNESVLLQLLMDTDEVVAVNSLKAAHHKIGAKILRCLSESDRLDYLDLVSHPHFLIEQMLINIKIEPLQKAFQIIRDDVKHLSDDDAMSFTSLNALLEIYAFKSVDFRVVQTVSINADAVRIPALVDQNLLHVIPLLVPSKDQWTPDTSVTSCMVCAVENFSMFNRRHHCRRCGRVVCGQCSQQRISVDGYGDIAVRVCDECFDHFATPLVESPHSLERRLKARFREASPDDGSNRSKTLRREPSSESQLSRISVWKLTVNAFHNNTAREEFSYEQAPNISLCLSILDLHWDQHRSGLYLLDLADNMFRLLQPIEPRRPNPEIDYNLVISMLKSVLLSAKVKFSKSCDGDGVSRCELYLSLADLLELLVAANCKDIIPVGDLTENDIVRRIRDQLILEERWVLALDVSTKGGLDVLGVWSAWGMACLRIGRYAIAREKFSFCLQRFKDQNKVTQINRLLQQILYQLESTKDANKELKVVMAASLLRLRNIKEGNLKEKQTEPHVRKIDSFLLDECLYYIEAYGNRANYLAFCVKCGLWDNAQRYTLDKKCPPTLFIEEVVMPSIRKGRFFKLLSSMKCTQFSFERWTPYLGPICRHLERLELLNVLYDVQVFVKDYVRAAITCITFFRRRACDYSELHDRLHHLAAAKQHLELYIQLSGGTFGTTRHSLGMSMSIEEVQRYLRCIKIQVEVTRFLHDKLNVSSKLAISETSSVYSNQSSRSTTPEKSVASLVPTVFDDSSGRAYVAAAVILRGITAVEGFSLANRIVKEFQLHAIRVYSLIASKLVCADRINDIPAFIGCLLQVSTPLNEFKDEVLLKAINVALSRGIDSSEIDDIFKLLATTKSKIEAFILCGKLKSAYLIAVKESNMEAIQRIQTEAIRIGQPSMAAICLKWLSLNQHSMHAVAGPSK